MKLSLMLFSGAMAECADDEYQFAIEAARFADKASFEAMWLPERHFTKFGSPYPNPLLVLCAIARETNRLGLRAGSIVAPLHHPFRLAEEIAILDNLSGGRAGVAFASGWHPNDFAFAPDSYRDRHSLTIKTMQTVRDIWSGQEQIAKSGLDERININVYPRPKNVSCPMWLTAAQSPETFRKAGESCVGVLTHLLNGDVCAIANNIRAYREARGRSTQKHPSGNVTLMLHTFLGSNDRETIDTVKAPYVRYLKSIAPLAGGLSSSRSGNLDTSSISQEQLDRFAESHFQRAISGTSLIGSMDRIRPTVAKLKEIGVDEIACLIDFGVDGKTVMEHLPVLADLNEDLAKSNNCSTATRANRNGSQKTHQPETANDTQVTRFVTNWIELEAGGARNNVIKPANVTIVSFGANDLVDEICAEMESGSSTLPRRIQPPAGAVHEAESGWIKEVVSSDSSIYGSRHEIVICVNNIGVGCFTSESWQWFHDVASLCRSASASGRDNRVWLITATGLLGNHLSGPYSPIQLAVYGFFRCFASESQGSVGGLIDVQRRDGRTISNLVQTLLSSQDDDEFVLSEGQIYVPRIKPSAEEGGAVTEAAFESQGYYLVTGGLGGLGFEVAKWLAREGVSKMVIIGRSEVDTERLHKLEQLYEICPDVQYHAVDAGNPAQTAGFCREFFRDGRRLAGIFHLASSATPTDEEYFERGRDSSRGLAERTMATKAGGSLWLAELAIEHRPSMTVLFSTAAAIFGSPGQSIYAGANSVLDGVALSLRQADLQAVSIAWGPISGIGFGAHREGLHLHKRWEHYGVGRMTLEQALSAMKYALAAEECNSTIAVIDVEKLKKNVPWVSSRPALRPMLGDRWSPVEAAYKVGQFIDPNGHLSTELIEAYLKKTIESVVESGGVIFEGGKSFDEVGLDSLLVLEVLFSIERDIGITMSIYDIVSRQIRTPRQLALAIVESITGANRPKDGVRLGPVDQVTSIGGRDEGRCD